MDRSNSDVKNLELRKKMWDSSISRHETYLSPITGLFDEKYVEERPCPVCNTSDSKLMFHKHGGTYVKCRRCDMVFVNPVFKDKYLIEYYSTNHDVQAEVVEQDQSFYTSIYQKGIDLAKTQGARLGSVLDYGCSSGSFLDLAAKNGFKKTFGLELNQLERIRAAAKGHTVFESDLRENKLPHGFDVISLWDVFEHLKDGREYLRQFKTYLNDGGLVLIQVPNGYSLAAQILQEKCNMFDGLEHVNLYNPRNVTVLAEDCGYEVAAIQSVISEVKVIAKYLNYEDPYAGDAPLINLPVVLNEERILKDLLGYKLQIVLRKK